MIRSFLVGFLITMLVLLAGLVGIHLWCGDELPSLARVQSVEPPVRTEIYDAQGGLLATFSREDRIPIPLGSVSPYFVAGILAIEDRNFYDHWGVDPVGLTRAVVHNATNRGGRLQGGSTITQQLAWNLFLTHEQTLERKLKELVMTLRLERSFSKDEILELYMNEIYFGDGAYGVETAARKFFGKSAADLTVSEAALLAGIPKHPARYSPFRNPEGAWARREVVLGAMLETGGITPEEYEVALRDSLRVTRRQREGSGWKAPYFVEALRVRLIEEFGSETTYEGGLKVYTTLDPFLQAEAEERLEQQLHRLEVLNRYDYLEAEADTTTEDDPCAPPRELTDRLQGAVISLDPSSGAVRVLVGGRDFDETEFNRALQARRQPGSAFKPFVFAAAIEQNKRSTDVLLDEPIVRFLPNGDRWEPTNFSKKFRGLVTIRQSLVHSINVPSVLLLEEVGVDRAVATARRMGIDSPLPRVLSLALGTGEVTLLELTAAYSPFANRGIYTSPYMIERVEDKSGRVLFRHRPETREALSEGTAGLVSDLMRTVVEYGTGKRARQLGLTGDAAGKTGTTDDYTDAWFVGYNTSLLTGVWVGFDQKIPIGNNMTGAACALPVWTGVMKASTSQNPARPFELPPNLVRRTICLDTGREATELCPDTSEEMFILGTEPQLSCPLHEAAPLRFPEQDPRVPQTEPLTPPSSPDDPTDPQWRPW